MIVLAYVRSPEGEAALDVAVAEAKYRNTDVLVVSVTSPVSEPASPFSAEQSMDAVAARFAAAGVKAQVRLLPVVADAATAVVDVVRQEAPDLVVIGLRRRTPVGKLLMGSTSQRILLETDCPVLAVKA